MSTEPPLPAGASCAFRKIEHHDDVTMDGTGGWRCTKCGTEGDLADLFRRVSPLLDVLTHLQSQMLDDGAVILLPSDATPHEMGTLWARRLFRLPVITEPMIAIPARSVPLSAETLKNLTAP